MSTRQPYTYVLLRYRHDPAADEVVNVGVLVHAPGFAFLKMCVRHTQGRLTKIFPDLDTEAFKATLRSIERTAERLAATQSGDLFASVNGAGGIAQRILPHDDSSYRWGAVGSGTTVDPAKTLDSLYARFVSKYDEHKRARRDDAEIWRPVRDRLEEKKLAGRLQSKTIFSSVDRVDFDHAWKNGAWHCYQPLSFDLSTEEHIREKARRWAGHMLALSNAAEEFKPYFFVGTPSDQSLLPAYGAALNILKLSPITPQIIEETDIDRFVSQIEDAIRAHDAIQS